MPLVLVGVAGKQIDSLGCAPGGESLVYAADRSVTVTPLPFCEESVFTKEDIQYMIERRSQGFRPGHESFRDRTRKMLVGVPFPKTKPVLANGSARSPCRPDCGHATP